MSDYAFLLLSILLPSLSFAQSDNSGTNLKISEVATGLHIPMNGDNCRYSRNDLIAMDRKAIDALKIPAGYDEANKACAELSHRGDEASKKAAGLTGEDWRKANDEADQYFQQASDCYKAAQALIPKDKDELANDWACLELAGHLHDDGMSSCSPDAQQSLNFVPKSPVRVEGKESYHFVSLPGIGFSGFHISKPYRYTMAQEADGKLGITVKIKFTGAATKEAGMREKIQHRLDEASTIWEGQSPGKGIHFHFISVGEDSNPDFTVDLKPNAKGDLYDSYWLPSVFTDATGKSTVAHELGHMMGIPDEYDPVRSITWEITDDLDTLRCNARGVMCDFYKQKVYPYYYYLITRRGICVGGTDVDINSKVKNSIDEVQQIQSAANMKKCDPKDQAADPSAE